MTTEEEIARVVANAQNVPFVGATQKRIAAAVMPLVERAQAEALARGFSDGVNFAASRRADRIENEGAGA